MNKPTQARKDKLSPVGMARALEEGANRRLAAWQQSTMEIYGRMRDGAIEGTKVANSALREHPVQAIGIAIGVGVGVLLGCFATRRGVCYRE